MFDVIEITNIKNIGFLVIIDIRKTFDSLDKIFLISTLGHYGFV